jgi:D-threo-aldose 1-dehydrogenase
MSLDESLERLGLDRVDLVYLHDPERHDLDLAIGQGLPALMELRESGMVSAVGVGTMTTAAIEAVTGAVALDVVMIAGRYTLLEQPAAAVFSRMSLRGTVAVAASVFNSGLLASSRPERNARYEYGRLPEELWDRLIRIARICDAHHVPLPVAAIQFPLRAAVVCSVVVGGSRPAQVSENAARMKEEIPDALWRDLAAAGLISR